MGRRPDKFPQLLQLVRLLGKDLLRLRQPLLFDEYAACALHGLRHQWYLLGALESCLIFNNYFGQLERYLCIRQILVSLLGVLASILVDLTGANLLIE